MNIKELAWEAKIGVIVAGDAWMSVVSEEKLEKLITIVRAEEQERYEKVCDAIESLVATIHNVGIPNVGARKVLNKACEDALKSVVRDVK